MAEETNSQCLGCNFVSESKVTLKDGRVVCSTCEDWREECEVRYVVGLETNERRSTFLAMVEKARGRESADHLRQAAWRELRASQ